MCETFDSPSALDLLELIAKAFVFRPRPQGDGLMRTRFFACYTADTPRIVCRGDATASFIDLHNEPVLKNLNLEPDDHMFCTNFSVHTCQRLSAKRPYRLWRDAHYSRVLSALL